MFFGGIVFAENDVQEVPPDPVESRMQEPPAGGGATLSNITNTDSLSSDLEPQPADSWEEAAVDGDPLLTPENEEVKNKFYLFVSKIILLLSKLDFIT